MGRDFHEILSTPLEGFLGGGHLEAREMIMSRRRRRRRRRRRKANTGEKTEDAKWRRGGGDGGIGKSTLREGAGRLYCGRSGGERERYCSFVYKFLFESMKVRDRIN